MNIKTLLVSVTITLSAWMTIGVAQAQTNYNFAESFYTNLGDPSFTGPDYLGSFSATFIGDGSANPTMHSPTSARFGIASNLNFLDATFTYTSSTDVLSSLQGNLGGINSGNYATVTFPVPGIPGYPSNQSFSFVYNSVTYNILGGPAVESSAGAQIFYVNSMSVASTGAVGAPEMNASFIPQVGLLLGCLFFLFGRKKQLAEPLLTA